MVRNTENISRRPKGKKQVAQSHHRRGPERDDEAQHQRVPQNEEGNSGSDRCDGLSVEVVLVLNHKLLYFTSGACLSGEPAASIWGERAPILSVTCASLF